MVQNTRLSSGCYGTIHGLYDWIKHLFLGRHKSIIVVFGTLVLFSSDIDSDIPH